MDSKETRNRLNFYDVTVRCRCVAKLVETIIQKIPKGQQISASSVQIPELAFLWEASGDDCSSSSTIAVEGIVSLVINSHLELNHAINKLLSVTVSARNLFAAIHGLTQLLLYQMEGKDGNIKSPYSLQHPKHPFITVLQSRPESWPLVLESIVETIIGKGKSKYGFQIMEPVLCYIFINPYSAENKIMLRSLLLEKFALLAQQFPVEVINYLCTFIPWLQVKNFMQVTEASHLILRVKQIIMESSKQDQMETALERLLFISLALCSCCLQNGFNTSGILDAAENIVSCFQEVHTPSMTVDACFILISVVMKESCGLTAKKLVALGNLLLEKSSPIPIIAAMMLVPAIQLLSEPSVLSLEQSEITSSMLTRFVGKLEECLKVSPDTNMLKNEIELKMNYFETFCSMTNHSLQCLRFVYKFNAFNREQKNSWLCCIKEILNRGGRISDFFFNLCAGLFLLSGEAYELFQICLEVLEIIVTKNNSMLSIKLFSLILYKLSIATGPESQLLLMEYLSKTATHKYATAPVLNILRMMAKNPQLKSQAIFFMVYLWKKQERCFSYLHKMLVEKDRRISSDTGVCEVLISQAAAIKELCIESPEKYGGEFLGALSTIINESTDEASTAAVALALDAVLHLCKSEVIEVRSTWKALAPKLNKDKRPLVATRMYQFLCLVPEMKVNSFEYDKFMNEMSFYLWKQVASETNAPVVIGAVYKALACFPLECHILKQLPAAAKINLKLPASMGATPFEMGKLPEDVLSYIPGYCFIDLLMSIKDHDVIQGFDEFLQSLIRQELKELPRGVYSQRKHLSKRPNVDDALSSIPAILCSQFESRKHLVAQKNLAVGVLLSYQPPAELGKDGKPVKSSIATQSRFCEQVLGVLLNEVNLDCNDWQRCVILPSAWGSFMERTFFICEESRRMELELQKARGHLQGTAEEINAVIETSWLWVRDRLLDLIKTAGKNTSSSLANSIFAVAGLVRGVNKFHSGLEENAKKLTEESQKFIPHNVFQLQCTESILCALDPNYKPSSTVLSWLMTHLSRPSSSAGSLIRGCAAASLCHLVPVLSGAFIDRIPHLCDVLHKALSESSPSLTLYAGIGLGQFIKALCQEGYVDCGNNQVNAVLKTAERLEKACMLEDFKAGNLIGLTLAVTAMSQNGNPSFSAWIESTSNTFYEKLMEEDSNSMEFEFLSICTSCMIISAAAGNITPIQSVEDLMLWFDDRRISTPQGGSIAASLGILVDSLQKLGHAKGSEMSQSLQKVWLGTLATEKRPTLHRLAALNGICALFSSGRGLLQIGTDLAVGSVTSGLKDLVKLMFQLLHTPRDASLQNICCWELGHIFSIHAGQQDDSVLTLPKYSYLNEQSILKPLTEFIHKCISDDNKTNLTHLQLALNALSQNFTRPLPPLNWVALLTPILQKVNYSELVEVALKIGLYQMTGSPSAIALISAYATPPIVHNLPENCQLLFMKNISVLALSLPVAKLQLFLQTLVTPVFNDEKLFEKKGVIVVQAMFESLQLSNCNKGTITILQEAFISMVNDLKSNKNLVKKHLLLVCKSIVQVNEESQKRLLQVPDNAEHLFSLVLILCNLIKNGQKQLTCLRPCVEAAKQVSQSEKEQIVAAIHDCFLNGSNNEESDISKPEKRIAFLMETIGWIRVLTDSESKYQLMTIKEVVIFLVDVCLAILIGSAGLEVSYTLWPEDDINHKFLIQSLPCALSVVMNKNKWNEAVDKIINWLLLLKRSSHFDEENKYYLQAGLCVLRSSNAFHEASVWTEIVCRPSMNI